MFQCINDFTYILCVKTVTNNSKPTHGCVIVQASLLHCPSEVGGSWDTLRS